MIYSKKEERNIMSKESRENFNMYSPLSKIRYSSNKNQSNILIHSHNPLSLYRLPNKPYPSHLNPENVVFFPKISSMLRPSSSFMIRSKPFDFFIENERVLMINPLRRGKGFKAVKLLKSLLGIDSIYEKLSPPIFNNPGLSSPERGLGQVIKAPFSRKGVLTRVYGKVKEPSLSLVSVGSSSSSSSTYSNAFSTFQSLLPLFCYCSCVWFQFTPQELLDFMVNTEVLDCNCFRDILGFGSSGTEIVNRRAMDEPGCNCSGAELARREIL